MIGKYKLLFNYIKTLIPPSYKVTFGVQEVNKENTIGVFFKGGIPQERDITTGEYKVKQAQITFNINSKKIEESVLDCMVMLEELQHKLDTTFNYEYVEGTNEVFIAYFECFGDVNQLGFNQSGIPCFSMNYIVHYN